MSAATAKPARVDAVPTWVVALSVMVLLGTALLFGLVPLISPYTAFPTAGDGGDFPIRFFAIRHLAFAAPLLYGIAKRDRTVLATMYAVFTVMAVLDVLALGVNGYPLPYGSDISGWAAAGVATVVFVVPMSAGFRALTSPRSRSA